MNSQGGLDEELIVSSPTLQSADPKFAILAELGRGGMATAYLASVRGPGGFNKLVVVKRLRASLAAEPDFLRMFLEEARLSARIDHPNVVHTTEVGFDGKHHYIAMEYLDGQSFENVSRRLLKKRKSEAPEGTTSELGGEADLPLKFHLHVISQALLGLDCAHELKDFDGTPLQVVHRDVSPHNIVVTYDGHVKLLDFGIAKAADSSGDTRTGVMKGKCAYMPAEQFGGRQIDRRADIFAVGVILWQALTGRRLWRGLSDAEIFQKVAAGDIKPPRTVDPDVPAELDAICMKALAHKADDRYATAAEFQLALDEYISSHPDVRTNARELGKFIGDLFQDDRAKMKTIIEAQLGKASSSMRSVSIPVLGAVTQSHSGLGGEPISSKNGYGSQAVALSIPPRPTRNVRLIAAVAVAALAVVVLASVSLLRRRDRPVAASPEVPTAAAASAVTVAPVTQLRVHSVPATAQLSFDGAPLDGNPSSSVFARDSVNHRVQADAVGYVSKSEWIKLDAASVNVDLSLDPIPAPAPSPSPGKAPASAPHGWTPPKKSEPATAATPASTPSTNTSSTPATDAYPAIRGPQLDKADPWARAPAGH